MRRTSLETYQEIVKSGLLSKRRLQAYEVLYENGPMTANELAKKASLPGLWKRLSELEEQGIAETVGEGVCSVTGRNCLLWNVTNNLPIKFEKKVKHPCKHCNGRGFTEETQARLF